MSKLVKSTLFKMIGNYIKEILRPKRLLLVYRHIRASLKYSKNKAIIGLNCSLKNVKLGQDVFIGDNSNLNNVIIGNHTYTNSEVMIKDSEIGCYVSIGSKVLIGVGKHPVNMVSTHPAFYSNNKSFITFSDKMYFKESEKIEIGHDVWIGSNATIMCGVKIGHGSIVAFGAIVTKDVPPYSIVGGIPATILKFRFENDVIEKLLKIKWWEFNDQFMKLHFKEFHNVEGFINYYNQNREYCERFRS